MMKRTGVLCAALLALAALVLPYSGYAQSAPDTSGATASNIRIEFRYTAGEEGSLSIPNAITRYGQSYHLVDKSEPVLEKTLPATRTYTWRINGAIPEDEIDSIKELEGVELTPVAIEVEQILDKNATISGLPANDVELIPYTKTFEVVSELYPDVVKEASFTRAAVRFEVEGDDNGLPTSYSADVIYRGLTTVLETGYYEAKKTYTTTEDLDGVPQYVVVATYAPDSLPAETGLAGGAGGGPDGGGAADDGDAAGIAAGDDGAVVPPIDADAGAGDTDIAPEPIPTSAGDQSAEKASSGFKLWMIPIIVLAVLAGGFLWLVYRKRRREKEKAARRETRRQAAMRARGLVEYD